MTKGKPGKGQLILVPSSKIIQPLPDKVKRSGRIGVALSRKALADHKPEEVKL